MEQGDLFATPFARTVGTVTATLAAARLAGAGRVTPRLLDLAAARQRRDDAIREVTAAAAADFKAAAYAALLTVIATRDTFLIDHVWEAMGPDAPETHERRAIAAVIGRARREGLIVPTGDYRPSAQPQCHANPRQVWRRSA